MEIKDFDQWLKEDHMASKIIRKGNLLGTFKSRDGERELYKYRDEYASCIEGGLNPEFVPAGEAEEYMKGIK